MTALAPGKSKWFGSVRISRDGRVRFDSSTFPGLHHVSIFYSSGQVAVLCGSREVLYLYLERDRVLSACFVYTLEPEQLRDAIQELRNVRGGLAGWIVPALEWTQSYLSGVKPESDPRRKLLQVIPELLESCGELPVANRWKKIRETPVKAARGRSRKATPQRNSATQKRQRA